MSKFIAVIFILAVILGVSGNVVNFVNILAGVLMWIVMFKVFSHYNNQRGREIDFEEGMDKEEERELRNVAYGDRQRIFRLANIKHLVGTILIVGIFIPGSPWHYDWESKIVKNELVQHKIKIINKEIWGCKLIDPECTQLAL